MSKIEVNTVDVQCGSTLTLGSSGKTVELASGASQSGFGRTGTVNWVTTKKTANFTAVSGEGYFCDTAASGAFTLTLPSSPSAGDIVGFKDYNGNFSTANLTIGRNSQPINGGNATDPVISTAGASIFLVYADATQGWVATQDDSSIFSGTSFLVATGGTITCCGDYKIHTFTSPGTFTVCSVGSGPTGNKVDYLVVGGGGSGGSWGGGAGGAGGYREGLTPGSYTASPLATTALTVTATGFPITVGAGGGGQPYPNRTSASPGSSSTFSTIASAGGGRGAACGTPGATGGSGGGGYISINSGNGLAGNTPPVSPPQGNNGGNASCTPSYAGGGGGGATAVGANSTTSAAAAGGAGATTNITSSPVAYSGGGGGGSAGPTARPGGAGGTGGGGTGGASGGQNDGVSGTANRGGGGGGAGATTAGGTTAGSGGNGGSGIVVMRYKYK